MKAIKPPTASATRKANARLIKDAARNKGEARRQLLARLMGDRTAGRIEGAPNLRPGDVVVVETSNGPQTMVVADGNALVPFEREQPKRFRYSPSTGPVLEEPAR